MTVVRYVALLRGVNVGKAKRVPMAELRSLLDELGFTDVKTLLNSGNAVFSGVQAATEDLALMIREAIESKIGVTCPVVVLTGDQMEQIARDNPLTEALEDPSRLLVSVFLETADRQLLEPLVENDWSPERFALGSLAAYTSLPKGVLGSQVLKAVERSVAGGATSRNWRTFQKIVALL